MMVSGLQASSESRHVDEGMLAARRDRITQSPSSSVSPSQLLNDRGRDLKRTVSALLALPGTASLGHRVVPCLCTLQVTQRPQVIVRAAHGHIGDDIFKEPVNQCSTLASA